MAVNDSEKKTRAILEAKTKKGEELQQFQEAQGQIVSLQAEQRNNLNEQRVVSEMEIQNNQVLAQAAEMLAASGGAAGGMVAAQPVRQNTGTQKTLSKFGLGKPGKTTSTKHSVSQSPQKISITNNTSTVNNNNIQLSQPQIPVSAPQVPVRAGAGGNDSVKFKAWINNAFAKQNEAAAIREKEYQKREWSLTRSTNKMIRKMGELGKTFAEKMSPKNLGNVLGDQLKTVMFLAGFSYLVANFDKFLVKLDNITKWFTGDGKTGSFFEGMTNSLVYALGGEEGQTLKSTLSGLFNDFSNRMRDNFEYLLESRGDAIKEVDFPEIDLSKMDMGKVIQTLGNYIGDVFGAAVGGPKAVMKSKVKRSLTNARNNALESYDDEYSHTQDADHMIKNGGNVSMGALVMRDSNFRKNIKMANKDYNSNGNLANNVESSIKQSQRLANLATNMLSGGKVSTTEIMSGLDSLKRSSVRSGETLVSPDFFDKVGFALGVPETSASLKDLAKPVPVRYIKVPKTEAELADENAGSFGNNLLSHYAENKVLGMAGLGYVGTLAKDFEKGNYTQGTFNALFGWNSGMRAGISATGAKLRNASVDDYTVKMVRYDDPRYENIPTLRDKNGKEMTDIYYSLTPQHFAILEKEVSKAVGGKISFNDQNLETLKKLDRKFVETSNRLSGGNSYTDLEKLNNELGDLNYLVQKDERLRHNLDKSHKNDQISKMINRGSSAINDVMSSISNSTLLSIFNRGSVSESNIKITNAETIKNGIEVMRRLQSELGLTPTQAAGIVGNLYAESHINPTAEYKGELKNEKEYSRASGIAQWLGIRQKRFMRGSEDGTWKGTGKKPHETDLKTQIDFLIWELQHTHQNAVTQLKKVSEGDTKEAAKTGLGHFEFSEGYQAALDDLKEKNNKTEDQVMPDRLAGSRQFYESFNSITNLAGVLPEDITENIVAESPQVAEFFSKTADYLGLNKTYKHILSEEEGFKLMSPEERGIYRKKMLKLQTEGTASEVNLTNEDEYNESDPKLFKELLDNENLLIPTVNGIFSSKPLNGIHPKYARLLFKYSMFTNISFKDLIDEDGSANFSNYQDYSYDAALRKIGNEMIIRFRKLCKVLKIRKGMSVDLIYGQLKRFLNRGDLYGNIPVTISSDDFFLDQYQNNLLTNRMAEYNFEMGIAKEDLDEKRTRFKDTMYMISSLTGKSADEILNKNGEIALDENIINSTTNSLDALFSNYTIGDRINSMTHNLLGEDAKIKIDQELQQYLKKFRTKDDPTGYKGLQKYLLSESTTDKEKKEKFEIYQRLVDYDYKQKFGFLDASLDATSNLAAVNLFLDEFKDFKKDNEDGTVTYEEGDGLKNKITEVAKMYGIGQDVIRNALGLGNPEDRLEAMKKIQATQTHKNRASIKKTELTQEILPGEIKDRDNSNSYVGQTISNLYSKIKEGGEIDNLKYVDIDSFVKDYVNANKTKISKLTPNSINAQSLEALLIISNELKVLNSTTANNGAIAVQSNLIQAGELEVSKYIAQNSSNNPTSTEVKQVNTDAD